MEWTMEQARKQWTPMVRPVAHVGVPGYEFQTGVLWDGSLVFGPLDFLHLGVMRKEMAPLGEGYRLHLSVAHGEVMTFADRKGTNNPAITRSLEGGRLPIPSVVTRDGDLLWNETVFAHLLGRPMADGLKGRADNVLVTHAKFSVRNAGFAKRTGHLWLHFGDMSQVRFGYKAIQGDDIAPPRPHRYEAPYGVIGDKIRYILPAPAAGELRWHDKAPVAAGIKSPPEKVIEWEVSLAPGEEAQLDLAVPYGLVDRATAQRIARLDSDKELSEVRAYWRKLENGPGQIITPDPFVNDYLVAVAANMAQQVADRVNTGVWMYKTSPNHYEGYWPCNAAKALPTFDFRGLRDINRKVLQSFLDMQTAEIRGLDKAGMGHGEQLAGEGYASLDGFLGNFGEWTANPLLVSHGLGMWTLAAHYRITRDADWLKAGRKSPLDAIILAFDWVTKQRERTKHAQDGQKVAYWGLLPAASAHDWLAGNTIFNDAYCIYGMAEVVRVLREIHHPRAEELAADLADYRKCLHDAYAAATAKARPLPLPDGSAIPFVPRMVQELDWARPDWTYTGYGPLRAGAYGALDPYDTLVDQSLAYLDAGMPKGEGAMFAESVTKADTADSNWADVSDPNADRHWMWRHYVEYETMWPMGGPLFLARDDLPRFFEFLFNNLAFVLHQDWRVGVESIDGVPSCAPGDGERWQIVRRMFINERGGYDGSQQSLWLLQAIPRSWLRPGYRMEVRDMGTHFGGKIDLALEVADDGESVEVDASLHSLAVTPAVTVMRLRSGDGRLLASAEVNGKRVRVLENDTIKLPASSSGKYHVVGRFGTPRSPAPVK